MKFDTSVLNFRDGKHLSSHFRSLICITMLHDKIQKVTKFVIFGLKLQNNSKLSDLVISYCSKNNFKIIHISFVM